MSQSFDYRREVYRKAIHLSSLWMPAVIYLCARGTALAVFAGGVAAVLAYEVLRRRRDPLGVLLDRLFGAALRPDEKTAQFRPSGAVYVLLAAFLSTLFFPPLVAMTAMAMMLTGDAASALIGRRFGRTRLFGKSLEGAAAFVVAAFATALVIAALVPVPAGYVQMGIYAAIVGAAVELVSKQLRLDDNLSVPLAVGAVMMLMV